MTRLERHKQKVFYQKVFMMVTVLILLLAFVFFIGFQFILRSSGFVGTLRNSSDTTTSTSDEFFGTLDVDPLPMATNSAQFAVSGSATGFYAVEFYINGDKADVASLRTKDSFNEIVGDLQKGKNEVYIKAITKDRKHSKKSEIFDLVFKNEKPKLEISEPSDNAKTDKSEIKVAGKTDQDVTIRINDLPTVVDASGGFQHVVLLKEGDNKIKILAEDDAGNTEQKEITVVYQKD